MGSQLRNLLAGKKISQLRRSVLKGQTGARARAITLIVPSPIAHHGAGLADRRQQVVFD